MKFYFLIKLVELNVLNIDIPAFSYITRHDHLINKPLWVVIMKGLILRFYSSFFFISQYKHLLDWILQLFNNVVEVIPEITNKILINHKLVTTIKILPQKCHKISTLKHLCRQNAWNWIERLLKVSSYFLARRMKTLK